MENPIAMIPELATVNKIEIVKAEILEWSRLEYAWQIRGKAAAKAEDKRTQARATTEIERCMKMLDSFKEELVALAEQHGQEQPE